MVIKRHIQSDPDLQTDFLIELQQEGEPQVVGRASIEGATEPYPTPAEIEECYKEWLAARLDPIFPTMEEE